MNSYLHNLMRNIYFTLICTHMQRDVTQWSLSGCVSICVNCKAHVLRHALRIHSLFAVRRRFCLPAPSKLVSPGTLAGTSLSSSGQTLEQTCNRWSALTCRYSFTWRHTHILSSACSSQTGKWQNISPRLAALKKTCSSSIKTSNSHQHCIF